MQDCTLYSSCRQGRRRSCARGAAWRQNIGGSSSLGAVPWDWYLRWRSPSTTFRFWCSRPIRTCSWIYGRLEIGIVVPAWQLRDRTEGVIAVFELASLLKDETPYPFRLHCEQHKLTPVVYDMLKRLPHAEVRFSSCVTEVSQDADSVTVKAETPDGIETFSGLWVIGADGGGSIVRKAANIAFDGFTYPEKFALISTPYDLGQRGFT